MDSEDFFAFAYPALIILGVLVSLIPAYIASKRNKSFWLWWISTASIFIILLLMIIKAQTISLSIYLLAILPVASILALLPRTSRKKVFSPILNAKAVVGSIRFHDSYSYLLMFILAGILYYYLLPHKWDDGRYGDKFYPAILALIFLMACLGYVLSIFMLSEKRKEDVFKGFLLTFLLSTPILLNPSRAFSILQIRDLIAPRLDVGSVIAALISKPAGGIFILFGLCSAPAAALAWFNDKYGIANTVVSLLRSYDYSPPSIHFSKTRSTPILVLCILYLIFFKVFYHPTEGWIFLLPLVWLCFYLPTLLLASVGTILSTVVIGISIHQKKNLYALGIFLCGLLAIWKGVPASLYRYPSELPVFLWLFYGLGSGLIALILWVISDYRGQREIESAKP